MRILLFILSLFYCSISISQVENGCININFETIPNEIPVSGLTISDQYKSSFGLSFFLETGGSPVLAEIGPPTEAFGSVYGNDTPAPGVDMGRFFLTDDGILSGITSPPMILRFDTPIDSFAGCIVDIDLTEEFIIQARDEFDNIILADTIRDGDPGTGDGELSCWGFNLPGCVGEIHSIRYEGRRTQSGSFGLGLDSFSFCYSGLNINTEFTPVTCVENGTIVITNTTVETYEYSMDGITYSPDGTFEDLEPGVYDIFIRDSDGCEAKIPFRIDPPVVTTISINEVPTSCDEDNGSVSITLESGIGGTYSLDGLIYQDDNEFIGLPPDDYTVTVIDTNQCFYTESFSIAPSVRPFINDYGDAPDVCGQGNGSVEVFASGGNGILEYSLDGVSYSQNPVIEGLTQGSYTIYIRDEENCIDTVSFDLDGTPAVNIVDAITTLPDCFDTNGSLEIRSSGGVGNLSYSIDGVIYQLDSLIMELPSGNYEITVIDELGCEAIQSVIIEIPLCPIYIPNVFTPDGDGLEDIFKAFTNIDYEVGIIDFRIYDRWGELVFVSGQFSIHTGEKQYWWDGYFNGKPANEGVYTYMIEVEHPNGVMELFADDVTLLR